MALVLSIWGKIAAMGIGALVVVIVLLVVVCFVGPGCWGYEWLNADEERERRQRRLAAAAAALSGGDVFKLSPLKRPPSGFYDTVGSNSSLLGRMESHRDSTYSSMSEATDRSSFRSVATTPSNRSSCVGLTMTPAELAQAMAAAVPVVAEVAAAPPERDAGPPQLHLTLQFVGGEDRAAVGRLFIGVKGASRLPAREYAGGLEPFVAVAVLRCSWPLHRRAGPPLHRLRTRALRHTRDPRFDQTFAVDARRHEVKDWSLRFTAYDQDRHGNPTELCFVDVSLRDVKALARGEEAVLNLPLQISDKEAGELLLGLSFLPTAQRLSVSVLRAVRLRYLEVADSLADFQPYVRVVQLHGSSGRTVRRKKTSPRPGSDAPEFNETLTFDLSAAQLETAAFLVLLCSRAAPPSSTPSTPSEPSTPDAPPEDAALPFGAESTGAVPAPRDRCLGKVVLGRSVGSRQARQHWLTVMQSPRSVHSAWHVLK